MLREQERGVSAFSIWLRSGRWPLDSPQPDGIEVKFNPWHDPADGRFTFAGTGRIHGGGGAGAPRGRSNRPVAQQRPRPDRGRAASPAAGSGGAARPANAGAAQPRRSSSRAPGNPVTEFAAGVGEGLYGVAADTVSGVRDVLTTNPVTTVRKAGRSIAQAIDTALEAEDVPARVQFSRAAQAIATASPRDIGRAAGSVAGNVALSVAPGAGLAKVSALRRLRMARPRPDFRPPEIGWAKETLKRNTAWAAYNDSASGARQGFAPTLMRTMPDGSKRPVKFDGIRGDYVIDRKWRIVTAPRAGQQVLRQSQVLAEHRLIGVWEVPTEKQRLKAVKFLKKMNVTNINVRVEKP